MPTQLDQQRASLERDTVTHLYTLSSVILTAYKNSRHTKKTILKETQTLLTLLNTPIQKTLSRRGLHLACTTKRQALAYSPRKNTHPFRGGKYKQLYNSVTLVCVISQKRAERGAQHNASCFEYQSGSFILFFKDI